MRIIASALLLAALAGCGSGGQPAASAERRVEVSDASLRLPPVPGRPAAAYFTLRANAPARIVAVTSPKAERIELHDMSMEGGVMRMGRLQDLTLPAGAAVAFQPGSKHAMVFGVDAAVKAGETIPLTFDFDGAPNVTVDVPVQSTTG